MTYLVAWAHLQGLAVLRFWREYLPVGNMICWNMFTRVLSKDNLEEYSAKTTNVFSKDELFYKETLVSQRTPQVLHLATS